jgi:hypothetical protein
MRLRSSSATAITVKSIFPTAVLVSSCSENETNSMPWARKVSSAEQVTHRSREAIELQNHDGIKVALVSIIHQAVKRLAFFLGSADAHVYIFAGSPAAARPVVASAKPYDGPRLLWRSRCPFPSMAPVPGYK